MNLRSVQVNAFTSGVRGFRLPWISLAIVVGLSVCPSLGQEASTPSATSQDAVPLAKVVSATLPAVVRVDVETESGNRSGTGFLLSERMRQFLLACAKYVRRFQLYLRFARLAQTNGRMKFPNHWG